MSETKVAAIHKKMAAIMKDLGAVGKDSRNTAQGFNFRGIEALSNALYPALVKHEVYMVPRVIERKEEIREVVRSSGKNSVDKHVSLLVEYDFVCAEDGSKITIGPLASEGVDSGDKSTNKALSAALKYAIVQTFSTPTKDIEDSDNDSPELGTSKFYKKDELAKATATEKKTFSAAKVEIQTVADAPVVLTPEVRATSGFRRKSV